jgi:molybdenum cofactor cytidylyltransferase
MRFGPVPLPEAEGAIVAHSLRLPTGVVPKGTVIRNAVAARLAEAGVAEVVVARPGDADVAEGEAAQRIAHAISGAHLSLSTAINGRVDLLAETAGVVEVDAAAVDHLNLVQDAIQVGTVAPFAFVEAGAVVATVKVIPFAVPAETLAAAVTTRATPIVALAPASPLRVLVIQTTAPHLKTSLYEKTRRMLDDRLAALGSRVIGETRIAHRTQDLADILRKEANADLIVIFGASATCDGDDVVPAAIRAAGGKVLRVGMPTDPGNLLVLGEREGVPLIGAPGCARSPARSGFDFVLERIAAGLEVNAATLARMGVGGVLSPKRSRGNAASGPDRQPRVDAVVLAAGQSSRMKGRHKLLARIAGKPLVRAAVEAALASLARSVTVVVGHEEQAIRMALSGLDVTFVANPDYATGLAGSLRTGIAALPDDSDAAVVLLADMPDVTAAIVDRVIAAFTTSRAGIVVPTAGGEPGNPVLWSRNLFGELAKVSGDRGGRDLIRAQGPEVEFVEIGPPVARDIDTPEAMLAAGGSWP